MDDGDHNTQSVLASRSNNILNVSLYWTSLKNEEMELTKNIKKRGPLVLTPKGAS
jgi:hypothetical protein